MPTSQSSSSNQHLRLSKLVRARRLLNGNLNLGLGQLLAADTKTGADHVTGHGRADAGRGSGQDDVAGLEGHDLGDVAQDAGDLEEHEVGGAFLLDDVVDLEEELNVVGVGDGGFLDDVAHGQKGVEALGDGPGETLLLGLVLVVACRHVDGEGIGCLGCQWL